MSKEIGLKLKQERTNKKLTIDDIANKLKIRRYYIEMMEAGNFKELPGITYIVGFIRSYAKLLEIDAEPLVETLKSESENNIHSVNVGLTASHMESALPSRLIITMSLIVLIIVYVIWSQFFQQKQGKKDIQVQSPPIVIEKINIEEISVTEESPNNAKVIENQEVSEEALTSLEKETIESEKINKVSVDEAANIPEEDEFKTANYGSENIINAKIVITAEEDSWIQIRNEEELLFSKVLLEGDKYYISDYNEELLFDTGNAGGIYIEIEGKRIPYLGERGSIVRDFMFTQEALQELGTSQ